MKTIEIFGLPSTGGRVAYGAVGYIPVLRKKGYWRWTRHKVYLSNCDTMSGRLYFHRHIQVPLYVRTPQGGRAFFIKRNPGYAHLGLTVDEVVALDALQEERLDIVKSIMDASGKPWRIIEL